jgi:hypothetical protein
MVECVGIDHILECARAIDRSWSMRGGRIEESWKFCVDSQISQEETCGDEDPMKVSVYSQEDECRCLPKKGMHPLTSGVF